MASTRVAVTTSAALSPSLRLQASNSTWDQAWQPRPQLTLPSCPSELVPCAEGKSAADSQGHRASSAVFTAISLDTRNIVPLLCPVLH
jgi:hypothetical protein